MQYLQEARSEMKVHQGLKVLVVGSYMAGKTSLVHSLVDQQSRLVEEKDRTVGVDHYDTAFEVEEGEPLGRSLQLTILDFSGHSNYLFSHYTFLTVNTDLLSFIPSFTLIVVFSSTLIKIVKIIHFNFRHHFSATILSALSFRHIHLQA